MRDVQTFARLLLAVLAGAPLAARADVTVQEQSTFDFTIIKAHGTTTELTTADKQRRDSDLHCEGFMSLLCGNAQSGEIIRLDQDVLWSLEPKKKEYRESHFPTLAERQAAQQQAQAMMEKLKQCPAAPQTRVQGPDTSKCEMTPPKIDVRQTEQHALFAGHDSKLTQAALSQSCRNKDTGDVCDFVITLDSWLTQDQIAGLDDRKAFQSAYLKKLGLDDPNSLAIQKQMRQFLAPYADSLKQLAGKAGDFKGYPLKTAVRVSFGGPHCAAAKASEQSAGSGGNVVGDAGSAAAGAAADSAASAAGAAAGTAAANAAGNNAGSSILGPAASAFGSKLVGGLFGKKKADVVAGANPSPAVAPNMVQVAQFTVETSSITPAPILPTQFDIPAGWKLATPQAKAAKEFSCPNSGT